MQLLNMYMCIYIETINITNTISNERHSKGNKQDNRTLFTILVHNAFKSTDEFLDLLRATQPSRILAS